MIIEYILPAIGIIAVLLLLSAFFSGSETALTAVSRLRMHERERQGDHRAARVNALTDHRERLIGSILLGNNLVNIGASALATGLLVEFFGDRGIAYATLGMTLLVLIFAEVLPKTYAIYNPIRVSLAVAPVMHVIVLVLSPVVRAVQFVVNGTLKICGVKIQAGRSFAAAEEELRGAIELHQGPEEDEVKDEQRMLRSILDLADVDVDEVLTHRSELQTVNADAPVAEIVEAVLKSPYTRIPAWRDEPDNIVGVIHAKALFTATQKAEGALDKLNIQECWQTPWFIPETTNLLDQLREFRARREHFAIVVDEYGALMGVVTLEDILEEIVGEKARSPFATSTASLIGTCPTRPRPRSPAWSCTRRGGSRRPGRSSPSTAFASRCCAGARTGSCCSAWPRSMETTSSRPRANPRTPRRRERPRRRADPRIGAPPATSVDRPPSGCLYHLSSFRTAQFRTLAHAAPATRRPHAAAQAPADD
jgi:Mg2+/Co2+ transporter CorB